MPQKISKPPPEEPTVSVSFVSLQAPPAQAEASRLLQGVGQPGRFANDFFFFFWLAFG